MKKALPLIFVAGGAALLMGGKKKKSSSTQTPPPEEEEEPPVTGDDEETDEGDGPETEEGEGYGKVASGIRKDRLGSHPWRIMKEEDGLHAQLMTSAGKFGVVGREVGVTASLKAAKEILRDFYNNAILEAGFSEDDFVDDPATPSSRGQNFRA